MDITIDYNDFAKQMLPPDKRTPVMIAQMQGFLSAIQWDNKNYNEFLNGADYITWDSGTSFAKGDRVNYNYAIYESLVAGNSGNVPPLTITKWVLINTNFLGVQERKHFNYQKMVLEYALNRYFNNGFYVQPISPLYPEPGVLGGSIYITNVVPTKSVFYFGDNSFIGTYGLNGSIFYPEGSQPYFVFDNSYTTYLDASSYQFTVHVPFDLFGLIPGGNTTITTFLNGIICAGITFNIVTY